MTSHLELEVKEKVLEIKINKPKVNAIDLKLSQDLGKAFAELRDNPDLRVGIITVSYTHLTLPTKRIV